MNHLSDYNFDEELKYFNPQRQTQSQGCQAWNELFLNQDLKRIIV